MTVMRAEGFRFDVGSARFPYAVTVGGLAETLPEIAGHRVFVVDARVWRLYPDLAGRLAEEAVMLVEATEEHKALDFATGDLLPFLIGNRLTRSSTVVAIGGGIVQDLVGFVCSILFRGVSWWFFPTTLLAQADSCIGSKTSINYGGHKNILGTFFPARRVVLEPAFLDSLTDLDFHSGVGEIIKIYLLEGEAEARRLEADFEALWSRDPDATLRHTFRSLEFKKRYIERDEFDSGTRLVLNYGHCFGHALEAASGYRIPHGIGVMYGMAVANRLSERLGQITGDECRAMNALVEPYLLLTDVASTTGFDAILNGLRRDKKNTIDKLVLITTAGFGEMSPTVGVDPADIRASWEGLAEEYF